ncbi:hypothetical protein [Mycobacteroides salmoniphilum]|uniref:Uncharacterized protein n=1 Tax=Mycobacteroides salmoniphilum TaxID=404941 RepID=A0A4R8SLN3_9MYCO|nr:hypothetical protein [Mycobacteroides salmoniphilum]TDZ98532.1 hypothetical protein CCUG60885_00402 [Mycobacteroides salmoniphilum]TEA03062.1 hypothetical protein CCUG60883_03686 [Mycobacteroides salmoniphilum]
MRADALLQHWITLHPAGKLQRRLGYKRAIESYLLVVENLPRAKRPVGAVTFGKSEQ